MSKNNIMEKITKKTVEDIKREIKSMNKDKDSLKNKLLKVPQEEIEKVFGSLMDMVSKEKYEEKNNKVDLNDFIKEVAGKMDNSIKRMNSRMESPNKKQDIINLGEYFLYSNEVGNAIGLGEVEISEAFLVLDEEESIGFCSELSERIIDCIKNEENVITGFGLRIMGVEDYRYDFEIFVPYSEEGLNYLFFTLINVYGFKDVENLKASDFLEPLAQIKEEVPSLEDLSIEEASRILEEVSNTFRHVSRLEPISMIGVDYDRRMFTLTNPITREVYAENSFSNFGLK